MAIKSVQVSFAGGVVSPAMFGRVDDQKYKTGLAKCENFVCSPQGAVFNRPGFEFVRLRSTPIRKPALSRLSFLPIKQWLLSSEISTPAFIRTVRP